MVPKWSKGRKWDADGNGGQASFGNSSGHGLLRPGFSGGLARSTTRKDGGSKLLAVLSPGKFLFLYTIGELISPCVSLC